MESRDAGFRTRHDFRLPFRGESENDDSDVCVDIEAHLQKGGTVLSADVQQNDIRHRGVGRTEQRWQVTRAIDVEPVEAQLCREALSFPPAVINDENPDSPWRHWATVARRTVLAQCGARGDLLRVIEIALNTLVLFNYGTLPE